ncbi:MAG: HNH endonuclease [Proteobacteria bacterium]|nr:HNH endonuclease [Pseudomonadota bacterium]
MDMKEIPLTQNQVTLVDDKNFEFLNQWKWFANKNCNTFYAARALSIINGKRRIIKMHHEIIGYPPKGFEVDHKNGQGLDNQRHNLRFVTKRQNHQNRRNQKSSSKYPGVSWDKEKRKWEADITINGKFKFLGYFIDEFEAFDVYKQAVEAIGEEVLS